MRLPTALEIERLINEQAQRITVIGATDWRNVEQYRGAIAYNSALRIAELVFARSIKAHADRIATELIKNGFGDQPHRQALAMGEEVGEFIGAYRRWQGMARRSGTELDALRELADVVITAYITASEQGWDLDAAIAAKIDVIFERGWRTP